MTFRYMIACRRSRKWIERMTLLIKEGRLILFEYNVIAAFTILRCAISGHITVLEYISLS